MDKLKKTFKNFIDKQGKLLLILSVVIISYFVLIVGVLGKKSFILENDQWFQYNIFYKEWIRLVLNFIKTGNLPMYSWNMYLGTDFYSAMCYYCTGDIFLPILLLLHNHVIFGLIIETILCIYISGILMNILLEKWRCEDKTIRLLISLAYAIGGYSMYYLGNYMFHRFYAFLPLLFIGLLNYFNNKKVGTFIIATAILFLQNYYFMYPTLIFLFIFSLMYEIKNKKIFKDILKDFFILLGCLLVGFMISAVITLPSMMYLLDNPRVGEASEGLFWQRNTYYGLFMSLITYIPWNTDQIFRTTNGGHDNFYQAFMSILPLLGCINYLTKKENRSELISVIILILFVCIKPLASIMNGFSTPSLRWTFLLSFYILLLASKGLKDLDKKKTIIIYVIYTVLYILEFIILENRNWIDHNTMETSVYIIYVCVLLSIIIVIAYIFNKKLGLYLTMVELVICGVYNLYTKDKVVSGSIGENVISSNEINEILEDDLDTYRFNHSYLNEWPSEKYNQNKSLEYGFMGVSTYNSMMDYSTSTFNKLSDSIMGTDETMNWDVYVKDAYANVMLGNKYYIVSNESELPKEFEFELKYSLNYLNVYENLSYQGFGYTSNNLKYTSDFTNTKDFIDYILVDDESIDISKYNNTNISYTKLNITSKYDNYLEANITLDEDNILLIPIPNNKGWTIKVNGKEVTPISVNGGFIGLELSKGYNEITMNFISPYFKEGLVLTTLGIIGFVVVLVIQKKKLYN